MTVATVVSEGFGSFGSIAFIVTEGYGSYGATPEVINLIDNDVVATSVTLWPTQVLSPNQVYLTTEAGEYILTEAGDYIIISVSDNLIDNDDTPTPATLN